MADQTLGAVGSLLGVLSKVVKDEAKLLGGVEGDIQFIRDEMDSMNGFLVHVTKTTNHDDQLRAWMKQVRDITYVADDCIKLYMRDVVPEEKAGLRGCLLRRVPSVCKPYCSFLHRNLTTRDQLARRIHELKDRVREISERRQRYDVKLPEGDAVQSPPVSQDRKTKEKRDEFVRALEDGQSPFRDAVRKLSSGDGGALIRDRAAPALVRSIVDTCITKLADDHDRIIKMLLRSLYAHPCGTKELENLSNKLREGEDVAKQVMLFCYSKLSVHYKSCLQYLITFELEESISRTSLVRRWLAEGLVLNDQQQHGIDDDESMEEAGERCFDDLLFRGFLSPAPAHRFPRTGGLKLKCCVLDASVKTFIYDMSTSENFLDDLPTHLRHQINIRKTARRRELPQKQHQHKLRWTQSTICCCYCRVPRIMKATTADAGGSNINDPLLPLHHPMDEIVTLLKTLPPEYRLNVLDLGGCLGLKMSHLKNICKLVPSLKYLSLRKTNVSQLPKKMNRLLHLETLDIRDTNVRGAAMRDIFLNELKHLLVGRIFIPDAAAGDNEASALLSTVLMPPKISKNTEILRHIQIKDGPEAQLQLSHVASLDGLRKLGVVLDGREDNIKLLLTTIARRSDTLRSLSVWITEPPPEHSVTGERHGVFVTLDHKEKATTLFSHPSKLESLNLKCYKGKNNNNNYNIPPWIISLQKLSKITLRHSLLSRGGLRELGKMKSLRCLKLRQESYIEADVTVKYGEFEDLRLLVIDKISNKMTKLVFEEDAAPKLEKIVWNFDTMTTLMGITVNNIKGIENLQNLKELWINGVNIPFPSRSREWKDITTVPQKLWRHTFGPVIESLASES
ncbi:disease resistance protein PIK6-NP-like [Oryza sativa Japonica Group]|uniref:Leucine Rich Repeat family protein, expressed n=3 Tax=Oryza TaxID=4527 RepID=Q2R0A3_ORYSJ|nr:disease resistance protein PIK6-NP-like [Oryza sativa Japonica Group]KAB8116013.1 hypothetical protein EE612_056934 [Oryza sativa]ABA95067.1 Leucine Rich Repeat family protein, expressed [Oryza sativa Japonica Group]EAZ19151.1 hypothetical protein OsJ_34685 [Oryza sativa Japonica Group]BAF28745.1 Os11g0653300 [Oryza sativa Japonica Group]BAT15087.1 Os11g0653300 [Oryza sativa Japonica Group]|eukprot:NP_001068382.1 Os11g0653300 [Oryza sativa Japonica Group]